MSSPAGSPDASRVLLFSERNIYEQAVWRCAVREFEDLICQLDAVDLVAPTPKSWYPRGKRYALRAGKYFRTPLPTGINDVALNKEYDLFFAVCEKPSELLNLNQLRGWKQRCRTSVCWLTEFYVKDMAMHRSCLEVLSKFDHVIFMFAANEPFRKVIAGTGRYMPSGVDALLFSPYPSFPERSIDVLSIGRRSAATHQGLLELARERGMFYVYDTMSDLGAQDVPEHRFMVASMAKRSRYFLVNPGKINAPDETGGQVEFGYRYVEGAAPGAILLGERPRNVEFDRVFDWEDAVIEVPFDSPAIGAIIRELDAQPERQHRIRTRNMVETLLRHDWVYRWEAILALASLPPLPPLLQRKTRLQNTAAAIRERRTREATAPARSV